MLRWKRILIRLLGIAGWVLVVVVWFWSDGAIERASWLEQELQRERATRESLERQLRDAASAQSPDDIRRLPEYGSPVILPPGPAERSRPSEGSRRREYEKRDEKREPREYERASPSSRSVTATNPNPKPLQPPPAAPPPKSK